MRVYSVDISGFRGVKTGRVTFSDFTVLIGSSNSGKTTVIEALALLFGRDRLVRSLTEHDFYGSNPQPTDRIKIVATITDFIRNDLAGHDNWFRMGRAVPKWLNSATGRISTSKQDEADLLICQIAFCARFDRESLEVESLRYFLDDEDQTDPFADDANAVPIPMSLLKELGFFLVPASRTWDKMISFGSELFRRAVAYVGGKPAEAVLSERDRLRSPDAPLEADEKLKPFVDEVNKDILSLFGRHAELKLRLTSTDSAGVLEAVIPHFSEGEQLPLPSRRHGSGLISLQTLILLMQFGNLRTEKGENFLMAIEEPELHVPPPQQRKLLHIMQKKATQTIVTTHSPTVAAVPNPHQLVLLVNVNGKLTASSLIEEPLGTNATNPRRGLFISDRDATVTAIMHPSVIIPEGKSDASWLRLLARVADISSVEEKPVNFTHEVGVIPTKDARIAEVYDDLQKVHPQLTCLVDGDSQGKTYLSTLAAKKVPPDSLIIWPDNWKMEDVIVWILIADESVLQDDELRNNDVPNNITEMSGFLESKKSDEVLQGLVADAISMKPKCCARVGHLLNFLAAVAMRRPIPANSTKSVLNSNGRTKVWTFNDAISRI